MSEEPKENQNKKRVLLLRLLKIAAVLFPISYVAFSLLVKSWLPFDGTEESVRHIVEWMIVLAAAIGVTFFVSLLQLKGRKAFWPWFALFFGVGFLVIFSVWRNYSDRTSIGMILLSLVYAAGGTFVGIGLFRFARRHIRQVIFGTVCLITLIALFYAEEDYRGWHAWQKFKHEQEAKGEKLDVKDFTPPSAPDDQNFAFTPIVASSYAAMLDKTGHEIKPRDTNVVNRLQVDIGDYRFGEQPASGRNWLMAKPEDLTIWQNYYRTLAAKTNEFAVSPQPQSSAQDVLLALSKYDSTIEELREAAKMPDSRFPLEYDKDDPAAILLPHLAAMKRCALLLELRAEAELQNGQIDKAFADTKLGLLLIDKIQSEPFIITHLVRIAVLQIMLQPVYDGLGEHKWSDAQLAELDSELAKIDFLADYERSIRGETAFHGKLIDYFEQKRNRVDELRNILSYENNEQQLNHFFIYVAFYLGPKGWFDQNKITVAQMNERWNLSVVDDAQQIVSPQKAAAADNRFSSLPGTPYNFVARPLLSPFGSYGRKTAYGQTFANLARVAIALERYRLAQGSYPDSLDAIAGQFPNGIPHDVINSQPLHYHRTSDGQFVLYSVGWDETDDGGVVVFRNSSNPRDESKLGVDPDKGDWVWRYPQK